MNALMTGIRNLTQRRTAERTESYESLVTAAVAGKAKESAVAEFLEKNGISIDTFEAAVAALEHRQRLAADYAAASGAEAELAKVQTKLDALSRQYEAAVATAATEHDAAAVPLHDRGKQLEGIIARATAAESELRRTMPAAVKANLATLNTRRADLNRQLAAITDNPSRNVMTQAPVDYTAKVHEQLAEAKGRHFRSGAEPGTAQHKNDRELFEQTRRSDIESFEKSLLGFAASEERRVATIASLREQVAAVTAEMNTVEAEALRA